MCLNLKTFFTFSLWLHPQKYMPNQYPEHYSIKEKMLMIVIGIVSEIKKPLSLHIHPNHQYKLDISKKNKFNQRIPRIKYRFIG